MTDAIMTDSDREKLDLETWLGTMLLRFNRPAAANARAVAQSKGVAVGRSTSPPQ